MARGLLHFTIRSATNLHKHDIFGRQQPYCHIVCGKYSDRTKTVKDGGQHPEWKQTLFFHLNNETQVEVTIYAEQRIGKDAFLGAAVVPIVTVRTTGHQELSVPVMRKDKPSGELHITMEFRGSTMSQHGQIGQIAHSSSLTYRTNNAPPTTPSPDPSVHLAPMPVRLLQQPASPLLPPQQQPPQVGSNVGSYVGATNDPADLAAAAAEEEARQLLLQRQQSVLGLLGRQSTSDAVAVQQYSQQLQQLHALHAQLLSSLPPEQQQSIVQQQQQRQQTSIAHSNCNTAAAAAAGEHTLQLPKQPTKTAADLFMPGQRQMADSSSSSNWQQPISSDMPICDLLQSGDAADVPCKVDINRLKAIIAKVYPGEAGPGAAAADSAAASFPQLQQGFGGDGTDCSCAGIESIGLGGFGGAAGLAAAAAAVGAAVPEEGYPPAAAGTAIGTSAEVTKNGSTGIRGGAATAAAASTGAAGTGARMCDSTAALSSLEPASVSSSSAAVAAAVPVTNCHTDISSIGLGGFGGAAGCAAAAAAAAEAHDSAAAAAAAGASGSAAVSLSEAAMRGWLPAAAAAAAAAGSTTPSIRSALDTPATTLPYSYSGRSTDLAVALSNVSVASSLTGTRALLPAAAAAVCMPGDHLTAVLADQLENVRRSAQLLGLTASGAPPPPPPPPPAAAAAVDQPSSPVLPDLAAAGGSCTAAAGPTADPSSRVLELEGLLQASYQDQIRLTVLLQERDQQMQLLLQQYLHSQHQVALLQARIAHMEQQQQQPYT